MRLDTDRENRTTGRRWLVPAILSVGAVVALAVLGTILLGVLFSKGNPVVSRQIVSFLSASFGTDSTRLESDGVHGSLFGGVVLERPRLVVLTPDGKVTWMSARRLTAEYGVLDLLFSSRRSLVVTVDSPVLSLVHDKRGNLVVPRFRGKQKQHGQEIATRIDVRLHDGLITLDRSGVRFGKIEANGVALLEGEKRTIEISHLSGVSQMQGRPGRIRAEGSAVIERGIMRVEPLYVSLDRTRVRTGVVWDLAKARVISSSTGFAPLDLKETMTLLDLTPVTEGSLTGELWFAGDPASGVARIRLSGTMAGEPVDTLSARAVLVPGAVRIEEMRARVRNAEVSGRAVVETRGVLSAEAHLRNVDPALLPWWHLPSNTPHGLLNGLAVVHGRKGRPYPAAQVALKLDAGHLGRFRIERGAVVARLGERGDIAIDTAWVDTPGARLLGSGRIAPDTTMAFSVQAAIRDLGAMDSLLNPLPAESGQGRIAARIAGSSTHPEFQLQGVLTDGRLKNGLAFDSLRVVSRGRLGSPPLATADFAIGKLRAGSRPLGDVSSSVTISDHLSIDRYRQVSGDTTLALHGVIRMAPKSTSASLDSVTFTAGTRVWRNLGPVEATLAGDRIELTHLTMALESGRLDVAGAAWLHEDRVDLRGAFQGVDLSRAFGRDSLGGARGIADGDLAVSGSLSDPDILAKLRVLRPCFGGVAGDSLSADVSYTPGVLTVTEARWASGMGRASLTGSIRPMLTFQDWVRAVEHKDKTWASKVTLSLYGTADSLDLGLFAPIDTSLATLRGKATGTVRIGGTAAKPGFSVEARGSSMAFHDVQADSAGLAGSYADQRFRVDRLDLKRGNSHTHLEGSVPIDLGLYASGRVIRDRPMELSLRAVDADFGLATLFVPLLGASAGKLNVTADMKGTPAQPSMSGTAHLEDGVLRIAGRDEVLEKLQADATFDEKQIQFTRIAAQEGKRGHVTGAGWWRGAAGRRSGNYEFKLHATEFTVTDRESYLFRFSGDFLVKDAVNPFGTELPRVTTVAPATLLRGELTMDLSQPREELDEPMPVLYEIVLDVPRNLWYRNLDTEVQLQNGQLTLRNEGTRDLILGSLDVTGKYYLYSNEFRITQGTIDFTSLDRIDPEISIEAQTTDVRATPATSNASSSGGNETASPIYMSLSGRSSQLKVHLHDDQGHGEAYLWKVLTIGQFTSFGSEGLASETTAPGAGPDLALPVTNYLFRNAERWISGVGFIDTIDLRSGLASTGVRGPGTSAIGLVGIGKYVTPELYVRYSRDFSGVAAEQRISAEYRMTRHLLLRGEQIRGSAQSQQQTPEQQYNLDLKVRLEY